MRCKHCFKARNKTKLCCEIRSPLITPTDLIMVRIKYIKSKALHIKNDRLYGLLNAYVLPHKGSQISPE